MLSETRHPRKGNCVRSANASGRMFVRLNTGLFWSFLYLFCRQVEKLCHQEDPPPPPSLSSLSFLLWWVFWGLWMIERKTHLRESWVKRVQ